MNREGRARARTTTAQSEAPGERVPVRLGAGRAAHDTRHTRDAGARSPQLSNISPRNGYNLAHSFDLCTERFLFLDDARRAVMPTCTGAPCLYLDSCLPYHALHPFREAVILRVPCPLFSPYGRVGVITIPTKAQELLHRKQIVVLSVEQHHAGLQQIVVLSKRP